MRLHLSSMAWWVFSDMLTAGYRKLPYDNIFIEASYEWEAIQKFINKFNIDPDISSCSCCGGDYRIRLILDLNDLDSFYRINPIFITYNGITTTNINDHLDHPDDQDDDEEDEDENDKEDQDDKDDEDQDDKDDEEEYQHHYLDNDFLNQENL